MNIKKWLLLPLVTSTILGADVSFSGENWLQTLMGKKENPELPANYFEYDEYQNQGWRYLRDVFTFKVDIDKFSFDGKFYVDQPTMGFHPVEKYYYRELIKRRTLSWNGDKVSIKVGNFETSIGRGLTLSLQDDHTVELSNILDGVSIAHENELFSANVFAGRGQDQFSVTTIDSLSDKESGFDDYNYRDGLYGFSTIFYPFQKSELFSSTAIGSGLLLIREDVGKFENKDIDSTEKNELVPIQKRELIWLPSVNLSMSLGPVEFYSEYARLIPQLVDFNDTLLEEEFKTEEQGFATYSGLSLSIADFIINGEYINYFYGKHKTTYGDLLALYTDAPTGRHKQTWHMLTKHTVTPPVGDFLGYNGSVSWLGLEGHEFLVLASIGGTHKRDETDDEPNSFAFDKKYNEIYTEWSGTLFDKFDSRVGFDFGKVDKDHPDMNSFTLGVDLKDSDLFGSWGIGLTAEGQYNIEELKAAKDLDHIKEIAIEQLPDEDPSDINNFTHEDFIGFLNKNQLHKKSGNWEVFDKSWLNSALILSFYFKDKYTVSGLIESETLYRNDHTLALVSDVQSRTELYKSINFEANFNRHHSLEFSVGDFSRSKICNMGTCTKVPSYKGMKLTFKSTF